MMTDAIVIRRLGAADRDVARTLFLTMSEVFETEAVPLEDAYLDALLARPDLWVLAAWVGGELAGGLTAHTLPMTRDASSELFVYDLAVRPAHQRKGVARALVSELRSQALASGIRVAFVSADEEDDHALSFYRATGGDEARVRNFTWTATDDDT